MNRLFVATPVILLILCIFYSISCVTIQEPVIQKYIETTYVSENRSETCNEIIPVTRTVMVEEPLIPYVSWSNPRLKFGDHRYLWYYGYDLSKLPVNSPGKLKILLHEQKYYESNVVRAFDMTPRGQILRPPQISAADMANPPQVSWTWITMEGDTSSMDNWINLANIKLNYAHFLGGQANLWSRDSIGQVLELNTRGAEEIAIVISGPTIPQNARFTASLEWEQTTSESQASTGERQFPYQREIKTEKERTIFKARQVPFWELLFNR